MPEQVVKGEPIGPYSSSNDCAVDCDSDFESDSENTPLEFPKRPHEEWITKKESLLSPELRERRERRRKCPGRRKGKDKTHAPTSRVKQDKKEKRKISRSKAMDKNHTSDYMSSAVRGDTWPFFPNGYNWTGW